MEYIYHHCPEQMQGNELYPLNEIKALYPDIYEREIAKYSDHPSRVALPNRTVPLLGCLWNDVVHCSPVHPHLLYQAWCERGMNVNPNRRFYRIPISKVSHIPIVIWHDEQVEWIDEYSYTELDHVPAETLAWYDRLAEQGKFGGIFQGVPHILVKGAIDISTVETFCWGSP